MNQNIKDILGSVKRLTDQVESMQEIINAQHLTICQINRTTQAHLIEIRNLKRSLKEKDKTIAELSERLSKYEQPPKNSNNSNTPPSKERIKDEACRRTKTLRQPTGRKPGGQKGHKGSTLVMNDTPTEIVKYAPDYCTKCGTSLEEAVVERDYVSYVISLPELKPIIKEIHRLVKVCKQCGKKVSTISSIRPSNSVTYDASVKSLVVYLSCVQFLSYERIESLFRELFGLSISQGSMVNWVNQAKKAATPAIQEIIKRLKLSSVVGFDESGCYCNKRLDWAWIAQTVYFTLVFHGKSRRGKELEERFGNSIERMVAVTDRHNAYFALNFLNHQVCLAHLLRECQYLNELNKKQSWSKSIESLLKDAIHERNTHQEEIIDKKPWLERLDKLITTNISNLGRQFKRFQKGLVKCRDYIFNFLSDPSIPADNNASERGIRKLKIKMKNSGCFRSDQGADAFMDIHSIVETAKKHQQSPLNAILALF